MPSSFSSQIATILHLVSCIKPRKVLDIGKGYGKYGFLLHEYLGIPEDIKIDRTKSMKEQSRLEIDCVEVDEDLLLPHLGQFYREVIVSDIIRSYESLGAYDLVMMIDVIEHLPKADAIKIVKHFVEQGAHVLVATPHDFFEQERNQSVYEHHVSHWKLKDFRGIGFTDHQRVDAGMIYCISKQPFNYRGFGHSLIKRVRRILRSIKNEI